MFRQVIFWSLLLGSPAFADAPKREPVDQAVARGLEFLARTQQRDGSWRTTNAAFTPAISGLCVMAFLSAGHVPGEGKYGKVVLNGSKAVLSRIREDGTIPAEGITQADMYTQGIGTLMLAEVIGMLPAELAKESREKLRKCVRVILQAQRTSGPDRGGWRYTLNGTDADLSVTGWQFLALRAARNAGCDVPGERIAWAVEYVRACHTPQGGFAYQRGSNVTLAMTGTGILCLELAGKATHRTPEALKAGVFMLKQPIRDASYRGYYGYYYGSQAMFQLGDNYWRAYQPRLHEELLGSQKAGGSWDENTPFGPNYATALAILALTVEYRLLPIYQRGETESSDAK